MEGFVEFSISQKSKNATFFNLTLENESILSSVGIFRTNASYSILYDDNVMCTFTDEDIKNGSMNFTYADKDGKIVFENRNSTSIRKFVTTDKDAFVQLKSI